jgi:hypothetical protein
MVEKKATPGEEESSSEEEDSKTNQTILREINLWLDAIEQMEGKTVAKIIKEQIDEQKKPIK